jgi:hypothetical protein
MPDDLSNLFQSEFSIVKDCQLIGRAARLGWDISTERRALLLDRLFGIVESDEDTRNAVAAAKAILAADTINQRREAARQAMKIAKMNGKNQQAGTVVNVNTAVQVNGYVEPTTNAERIREALALLDAARARTLQLPDGAANDPVHGGAEADAAPKGFPLA